MNPELAKGVDQAIRREQATYKQYSKLAKISDTPNLEMFFRKLALQEMKHEYLLEEFKKCQDFQEAKDKVESHYIDNNFEVTGDINANVSQEGLVEAFTRAMHQEREDASFYKKLMDRAVKQGTKDLFHYLIHEEQEHERLIRKEYDKYMNRH